jgi:hypothetical protein
MTAEQLIALILLVVSGILVTRLAPRAIVAWRTYRGTGDRRQQDASGRAPAPPPGIVDRLALFDAEGYHQIGVTSLTLPAGERFGWIVAADDAASYAILAGGFTGAGLSGIYSAWPDGTWLGTIHPIGQATDRPGLQVRVISTTIADAVALHREGLERLRPQHGEPRPVRSMPEMLAMDADYRERFGGSRLLPITMRIVVPALLSAGVFVLSALLLVSTLR